MVNNGPIDFAISLAVYKIMAERKGGINTQFYRPQKRNFIVLGKVSSNTNFTSYTYMSDRPKPLGMLTLYPYQNYKNHGYLFLYYCNKQRIRSLAYPFKYLSFSM